MDANEIIWRPDPETAARTRIARFMRAHGLATLEDLQRRSVEDLEWYWSAVARDLGWAWSTPYKQVVDTSRGIQWPRWFVGGRMNLTAQCVDVHVAAGRGDKAAVISEAEDGGVRTLTYAELGARGRARSANALTRPRRRARRHGRHLPADVARRRPSPCSRSRASARSTRRASRATAPRRWPRGSPAATPRC